MAFAKSNGKVPPVAEHGHGPAATVTRGVQA
jgi:hypothetical protein